MKKIIAIVLIVVIVICLIIAGILYKNQISIFGSNIEVSDVLSDKTLAYLDLKNVQGNFDKLKQNKLYQVLMTLDYDLLKENKLIDNKQYAFVKLIRSQKDNKNLKLILNKVLSEEFAIAVFPVEIKFENLYEANLTSVMYAVQKLLNNLTFITRVGPDVQFAQMLSSMTENLGTSVMVKDFTYLGVKYYKVALTKYNIRFTYTRIKDLIIASVGDETVKDAIEIVKKKKIPLIESPLYSDAQKHFTANSDVKVYADLTAFSVMLNEYLQGFKSISKLDYDQQDRVNKQIDDIQRKSNGIKSFIMSVAFGEYLESQLNLDFDRNKLDKDLLYSYTCKSAKNQTLKFVPNNVLGYHWSNCFDANLLFKEMEKQQEVADAASGKKKEDFMQMFEKFTGVSFINEVVPLIGDELGGFVSDIKMNGMFPVPEILVFVKTKDKDKMDSILKKIISKSPFPFQYQAYSNIDVNYMVTPFGSAIQPSYGFIDDYFVFAVNRFVLESSIDVVREKNDSLVKKEVFQNATFKLNAPSRLMQYVDINKAISKTKEFITWNSEKQRSSLAEKLDFQESQKAKLEELVNDMLNKKQQIDNLSEELKAQEDILWDLKYKNMDIAEIQNQVDDLSQQLQNSQNELDILSNEKKELVRSVENFQTSLPNNDKDKIFVEQFADPLINGFSSIKSYISTVVTKEDNVQASTFIEFAK